MLAELGLLCDGCFAYSGVAGFDLFIRLDLLLWIRGCGWLLFLGCCSGLLICCLYC